MKYRYLNISLIVILCLYLILFIKPEPISPHLFKLEDGNENDIATIYRLQNSSEVLPKNQEVIAKDFCQGNQRAEYSWIYTDRDLYRFEFNCNKNLVSSIEKIKQTPDLTDIIKRYDIEIVQSINGYYSYSKWRELRIEQD